jgi:hypothetical protein
METLTQLLEQSRGEIEAHWTDPGDASHPHFLQRGADLLASVRLWVQDKSASDETVREILRFADVAALQQAAADLENNGTDDGRVASYLITGILNAPQQEFSMIVGYSLMAF